MVLLMSQAQQGTRSLRGPMILHLLATLVMTLSRSVHAFVVAGGGGFAASMPHSSQRTSQSSSRQWASVSSSSSMTETNVASPTFASREDYMSHIAEGSSLPAGFAIGIASGTFVPEEAPAMGPLPIRATVIQLTDGPTDSWAAVFTKNKFPGAPIQIGRSRLQGGGPLQAIVINNKVSNVCSAGNGVANAERVCRAVADLLSLPGGPTTVLPCSTGVIGWRLPVEELVADVVPNAVAAMQTETALEAASSIMTTDRFPKLRSKTLSNGARIVGIAKGAGMIEPNMATMLCYLMTDATIEKSSLQSMLSEAVNQSFNSISVDGDESTSDTVALVASNKIPTTTTTTTTDFEREFQSALMEVCQGLSADIVRNGEGTGHVMRVTIDHFPGSDAQARALGRHVVNSPLFKCAVSGNDPNTGRLAGAIGSFVGKFADGANVNDMTLTLGGTVIFSAGKFVLEGDEVERRLSNHMKDAQQDELADFPSHEKFVEIHVDFGANAGGTGSAVVLGSDLTAEYVSINADYRS